MANSLNVLLVDEQAALDRALAGMLTARCAKVMSVESALTGLAALERGRATGAPFHLILACFARLGSDGLLFLRELQRHRDPAQVVLIADYNSVDGPAMAEAEKLGVKDVLDLPLDYTQIADVLNRCEAGVAAQPPQAAIPAPELLPEPPQAQLRDNLLPVRQVVARQATDSRIMMPPMLGGSSRIRRGVGAVPPPQQPQTGTTQSRRTMEPQSPQGGGSQPQFRPPFATPLPGALGTGPLVTPLPGQISTGRLRRSLDPPPTAQPPAAQPPPRQLPANVPPPVARPPQPQPIPTAEPVPPHQVRSIACGNCHAVLRVEVRDVVYHTICVHCGTTLRIRPT